MTQTLEKTIGDTQYDKIAEQFRDADQQFPDVTRPALYDYINQMDLKGKNVLDMGCGYGEDVAYLESRGAKAHGIDISDKMVELTKSRCPSADLKTAPTEDMPYKDASFRLIYSRYAIQHSENIEPILEEADRVLEQGGDLLFLVTHPFRQFFEKPTRDYWVKESIQSKILDGKVTVQEYSHTIEEYLNSPTLKNKFRLLDVKSEFDPAAEHKTENGKYPDVWIMHYRKV